jgi:hypothetical protein
VLLVRAASPSDADVLAPRLRSQDLQEIHAADGRDPLLVLREGVAASDPCFAVLNSAGAPVALFGAIPDPADARRAKVWLLGTPELLQHRRFVLRMSRLWTEKLHERYAVLWNFVDARNQVHLRWLEWCGFRFLRLVEHFGFEQRPFYEFERVHGTGTARTERSLRYQRVEF